MGELRPWHIAVLVVVLILLFGSKRLPDAARGLGRSMRILKAETKGLADDASAASGDQPATGPAASTPDGRTPAAQATPAPVTAQQVAAHEVTGSAAREQSAVRRDG